MTLTFIPTMMCFVYQAMSPNLLHLAISLVASGLFAPSVGYANAYIMYLLPATPAIIWCALLGVSNVAGYGLGVLFGGIIVTIANDFVDSQQPITNAYSVVYYICGLLALFSAVGAWWKLLGTQKEVLELQRQLFSQLQALSTQKSISDVTKVDFQEIFPSQSQNQLVGDSKASSLPTADTNEEFPVNIRCVF